MRELKHIEIQHINGASINIGKVIGAALVGAIGGLLRGIPGGPAGMVANAIAGAAIGAFSVSVHDAEQIRNTQAQGMISL